MSKELFLEQIARADNRERLQVENVDLLGALSVYTYRGEEIPSWLRPVAEHVSICGYCRDDVQAFKDAIQREEDAHMEYLQVMSRELDPYQRAEMEVAEISILIPPRGIRRSERTLLNALIRAKLPKISDLAVVGLMNHGHDLSRREFLKRLNGQRIQQIEAPFELMERMSYEYIHRPLLFVQAHQEAIRLASTTSPQRMVKVVTKYENSPMGRDDRRVFADILSVHPQMDEIVQLLSRERHRDDWFLDDIIADAEKKRATRRR